MSHRHGADLGLGVQLGDQQSVQQSVQQGGWCWGGLGGDGEKTGQGPGAKKGNEDEQRRPAIGQCGCTCISAKGVQPVLASGV